MRKRLITIAIFAVLAILFFCSSADWLQYFLAMVVWDLVRTVGQTWYLKKNLEKDDSCPKCKHEG